MEQHQCQSHMRAGWTVIELIFVILVIAILASIAVKRLTATRDDAKLSAVVSNMAICITSAKAHYTATHQDYTEGDHPYECDKDSRLCYDLNYSVNGKDFNVTLDKDAAPYCEDIEYVGGHLVKNYVFGGQSIQR